ncbi:ATP-binding cassette domain-containing protein [Rhodococcus oxybenzonivorans]|jgi:ABC-2 type transport system ATP-binding protein|uniref:ATP-binding cassette domain-containing protein n=1 Tax=Rhodococcus TaxID=1827 RepID=UPI00202E8038|nr:MULTISPECIES: ATP-binding cassette domain-containing protein [Rhodococcus]MDV7354591.1 ATP-binding cassette domain-containing protein [Rhodococcus oxybenzonivorans]
MNIRRTQFGSAVADRHCDPAITVTGLRKSFRDVAVLDGVDLLVPRGSVFALLGVNGAGKTTMVRILSTLTPADAGTVTIAGRDLHDDAQGIRRSISLTGQYAAVDDLLTAEENLRLMARLGHLGRAEGRQRARELLEQFDLVDAGRRRAGTYSGGMARRLDLAMSLVARPEVIFLDEPTTGLDPRSRQTMWDVVRRLANDGVTIFLTTQYLEEADQLADRVAVLDEGRIVAEGTPDELKRLVPGGHLELMLTQPSQLETVAASFDEVVVDADRCTIAIPTDGSIGQIKALLDRVDDQSVTVGTLSLHSASLDDVFFALTDKTPAAPIRNEATAR